MIVVELRSQRWAHWGVGRTAPGSNNFACTVGTTADVFSGLMEVRVVPASAHHAEMIEVRGATLLPGRIVVGVATGVIDSAPGPGAAAVADDKSETLER